MTMNTDPALWEMFRSEVDTHMAVLCDGLLALEKDPGQSGQFDSLMRAAHSIKGAAKIVGIPAAVQIAHALEDCFVAAREGRLSMSSNLVDVLFEGVDLLGRVAQNDASDAAMKLLPQVAAVTQKIEQATRGGNVISEPTAAAPAAPAKSPAELSAPAASKPVVFQPVGSLDAAWVADHHRAIAGVLKQKPGALRFDFSQVEAIDSIGIALLASITRPQNVNIELSGVSPAMVGLLRATGIDRGCNLHAAGG